MDFTFVSWVYINLPVHLHGFFASLYLLIVNTISKSNGDMTLLLSNALIIVVISIDGVRSVIVDFGAEFGSYIYDPESSIWSSYITEQLSSQHPLNSKYPLNSYIDCYTHSTLRAKFQSYSSTAFTAKRATIPVISKDTSPPEVILVVEEKVE
jgi:hypothetical protein